MLGVTDLGWTAVRMLELGRSRALMDLLDAADPGLPTAMIGRLAWRTGGRVSLARDRLAAALDGQHRIRRVRSPACGTCRGRAGTVEAHAERLRAADPRFWQLAGPRAADLVDPAAITASLAEGTSSS